MIFEISFSKIKRGKSHSKLDLSNFPPYRFIKFHKAIGDSLDISMDNMEAENVRLKEIIKELESTLMPPLMLTTPVSIIQLEKSSNKTPDSGLMIKGASGLLSTTMHYVEENIKKRMSLILETCDLANKFVSLGSKIQNTREYLQIDLTNDEWFYKDALSTFVIKFSRMNGYQIKQEDFPSPIHSSN